MTVKYPPSKAGPTPSGELSTFACFLISYSWFNPLYLGFCSTPSTKISLAKDTGDLLVAKPKDQHLLLFILLDLSTALGPLVHTFFETLFLYLSDANFLSLWSYFSASISPFYFCSHLKHLHSVLGPEFKYRMALSYPPFLVPTDFLLSSRFIVSTYWTSRKWSSSPPKLTAPPVFPNSEPGTTIHPTVQARTWVSI